MQSLKYDVHGWISKRSRMIGHLRSLGTEQLRKIILVAFILGMFPLHATVTLHLECSQKFEGTIQKIHPKTRKNKSMDAENKKRKISASLYGTIS